jgi:hypothetical protein
MENLFLLGSYFSDSATRVVALQCFRTKKCELFSLFYMIPDLELTVVKERRMWNY